MKYLHLLGLIELEQDVPVLKSISLKDSFNPKEVQGNGGSWVEIMLLDFDVMKWPREEDEVDFGVLLQETLKAHHQGWLFPFWDGVVPKLIPGPSGYRPAIHGCYVMGWLDKSFGPPRIDRVNHYSSDCLTGLLHRGMYVKVLVVEADPYHKAIELANEELRSFPPNYWARNFYDSLGVYDPLDLRE